MIEPQDAAVEDSPPAPEQVYQVDTPDREPVPSDAPATTEDKEAARYRRRLRETEKERDTLLSRVESLQRGEVERLAASKLADPADVWRDGASLGDLLGDDGNIDPAAVDGLLAGLIETHSHWAIPQRERAPVGRLRSGASAQQPPKAATWA